MCLHVLKSEYIFRCVQSGLTPTNGSTRTYKSAERVNTLTYIILVANSGIYKLK